LLLNKGDNMSNDGTGVKRMQISILCRCCKKPIDEKGTGMAIWGWDTSKEPVTFVHKGICDDRIREAFGGDKSYGFNQDATDFTTCLNDG
tara:strand:+ start:487 stop:756 length:270 start_codon:yes stop_codon:yes gene_type:complete